MVSENKKSGKRQGYKKGENDDVKQSYKKLGISAEDGWTAEMRTRYFRIKEKANKIIIENDYTNLDTREKKFGSRIIGKKDVQVEGGANLQAPGIWSDSVFDAVSRRIDQVVKHTIEKEEEKKRNGEKYRKIENLHDIKHHHTRDFIHDKFNNGDISVATAHKYFEDLNKFGEIAASSGVKTAQQGNFIKESTRAKLPDKSKEARVRSRKEDGSYGYSLEEAKNIIKNCDDFHAKTAAEALLYQGHRKDTLFKLQWADVTDKNGRVAEDSVIEDASKMKAGRVQMVETNEQEYRNHLESVRSSKGYGKEDLVFGKNEDGRGFSPYQLEKNLKEACDKAGVEWVGFHAFRTATVQYYEKEKFPTMTKEEVVNGLLKLVNVEVVNPKTGEVYKPHNPMVTKKEIVRDKNGNPIKRQNKNGGTYIVKRTVTDEQGKPVTVEKFTYDDLMTWRIDRLRNTYLAEQISHNRSDANAPYRNHKN